ncbi:RDD family protein [Streptomyces sp. WMMC940]|uniref:RDD family protein n=1 Tax=Streptomyces sp. WMMC940 TaxID=3015153 RepID=UPI0022B5EBC4|nr:RDD family protein [Streptomyces sp. WMMC940]MCZ7459926.1 RDD family protein [Streptomyces sp. WMMC940]
MSGVVTGDAVVLGLRPARLPSRALALVIDLALVVAAYLLISVGLAVATASLDEAAGTAVSIASFVLVLVGAPIAVETLSHGRSLGKLACGLRVVRDDGGPIRFRHALVRGAIGVVEILMTFGAVACIASLVSARGRRVGDVFAGTLVVRERVPAARSVYVPAPPPWLLGRFTELDLSGVPDDLWLAVRQYLTRMNHLDAEVGRSLAERLAVDLAACTGTPVPAGVPAGAFLAAVVNERQTRDTRRAHAAAAGKPVVPVALSAPQMHRAYAGPHRAWPVPTDHSVRGTVRGHAARTDSAPASTGFAVPGAPADSVPAAGPAPAPASSPGPAGAGSGGEGAGPVRAATGFAPPA